jgi:hypothetical protein
VSLSGADVAKLKSHQQWCDCRFVSFPVYATANITSFLDGTWTPGDMVNIHPRHSWVNSSAAITLDGNDSIQRDGSAATGHTWSLESGGGGLVDNSDGTATYTAPGGTGTAVIKLTTDGNSSENYAYVAFGTTRLNIGAVTGFHADITTGGWELTARAYGDCSGLERQKGVLLVVNDYWNGSEDTFGGYAWAHGVFYGYVDRVRTVHVDSEEAYLEVTIVSPSTTLNRGSVCDLYFVRTDSVTDDNIILADFMAIDAIWWMLEGGYNTRHNVYISPDDNAILNLKIGKGPFFDVVQDIAARTFYISYDSKLGDLYVVGDIDVRYSNYFVGLNAEFTLDEDLFDAMDAQWEDITDLGDPPSVVDPTYGQVQLTAVGSDLEELISKYPADVAYGGGLIAELGGLISETQADLDDWAQAYFFKLQPALTASIRMFLFHHVDLYSEVTWNVSIRGDLTNHGMGSLDTPSTYVTGIDYDIDPGLGTWRGSFQLRSRVVL